MNWRDEVQMVVSAAMGHGRVTEKPGYMEADLGALQLVFHESRTVETQALSRGRHHFTISRDCLATTHEIVEALVARGWRAL